MQTVNITSNNATIQLSRDELRFLKNAVNETVEALGADFSTRTGYTTDEARQLQTSLGQALQKMKQLL